MPESSGGNAMIGICYLIKDDADVVERRIEELCGNQRYDGSFWEEALYHKDRMIVAARVVHSADVVEINTYWLSLVFFTIESPLLFPQYSISN